MKKLNTKILRKTNTQICQQNGFSLVEIMIAMLISLFLLGGVIQVYSSTRTTYQTNEGLSRLQENARFIFNRMAADIKAAGYMGCNDSNDLDPSGAFKVFNRLTNGAAVDRYNFTNPVGGLNNSGVSHTGVNTSDRLFIRRAVGGSAVDLTTPYRQGDANITLNAANPNQSYDLLNTWDILALSDCEKTAIFMITAQPTPAGVITFIPGPVAPITHLNSGQSNIGTLVDTVLLTDLMGDYGLTQGSPATVYKVDTTRYDIQASGSASTFSLFLDGVEYVEDITDMEIKYGIDTTGTSDPERFVDASDAALAAAGLNAVTSMKVTLTLQATGIQVNGQPIRKNFTQIFRLRNRP